MSVEAYEVRQGSDKRGVDLISDALPFGRRGTASQTLSATRLTMQSIASGPMMRRSAFDTRPHPTNIHPQVMKHFFHCKDWADDSCFHLI